jgi:dihydrofolate synthase/folylpolyglutamate synthase
MAADYPALLARLDGLRSLGVDFGLDRVQRVLALVGSPERRLPAVQIAGTNGKGSTAAMTEAILRAAGWRTGLYTSPHLCRFTERIRVGGVEVGGDRLAHLDEAIVATGVRLTYFEVATLLAFMVMAEPEVGVELAVDLAVLETGLGGRLDAVTACQPLATAITSIGWDHMDYLGSTIRSLAREKAGILKPGVPCFVARLPPEAGDEIARVAAEVGAPLWHLGRDFESPASATGLAGAHQRSNAALAVALAVEAGRRLGRPISREAIGAGLAGVWWPGRLETLANGDDGEVLLDCAHNPEGAEALAAAIPDQARGRRAALVISVVAGKDLPGILRPLLPAFSIVVATRSRNPRSIAPRALAAAIEALASDPPAPRPPVIVADDPRAAIAEARRRLDGEGDAGGLVVVAGSIFLVGEVRAALLGERCDPRPVSDPL